MITNIRKYHVTGKKISKDDEIFVHVDPSTTIQVHGIMEVGQQLTLARRRLLATMAKIYLVAPCLCENI